MKSEIVGMMLGQFVKAFVWGLGFGVAIQAAGIEVVITVGTH